MAGHVIEVLGVVVLVLGTLVSVLAAWGIVDFPTPLARMHAATKPASLGLAVTVLGAAIAATEADLAAIGVLVAGGLFLTAPITGHLLGRAAYLAGQTPGLVHDDLAGTVLEPMGSSKPMARSGVSLVRIAVLTAFWVLLWGDPALGTTLAGLAVAAVLEVLVWRRVGISDVAVSPIGILRFLVRYVGLVVASTARVAWEVITPSNELREAIVGVPLRVTGEPAVVLLANAITYTPGTLTIEVVDGRLYVHVLHFEDVETTIAEVRRIEALVLAALPGPVRD
jgi:monovalent cation/proton antiporter MnhG/PhaG subunit